MKIKFGIFKIVNGLVKPIYESDLKTVLMFDTREQANTYLLTRKSGVYFTTEVVSHE